MGRGIRRSRPWERTAVRSRRTLNRWRCGPTTADFRVCGNSHVASVGRSAGDGIRSSSSCSSVETRRLYIKSRPHATPCVTQTPRRADSGRFRNRAALDGVSVRPAVVPCVVMHRSGGDRARSARARPGSSTRASGIFGRGASQPCGGRDGAWRRSPRSCIRARSDARSRPRAG